MQQPYPRRKRASKKEKKEKKEALLPPLPAPGAGVALVKRTEVLRPGR
jgi:hypothetical protein